MSNRTPPLLIRSLALMLISAQHLLTHSNINLLCFSFSAVLLELMTSVFFGLFMTLLKTFHLRLKAKHNTVVPKRVPQKRIPFFFALICPSARPYALPYVFPCRSSCHCQLTPCRFLLAICDRIQITPTTRRRLATVGLPFACVSSAFSVLLSFYVYTILYSY